MKKSPWAKLMMCSTPKSSAKTATFSLPGTYVLRLDANDGELQAAGDTMTVRIGATNAVAVPAGLADWWPANGEVHEVVHGNHDIEFLPRGSAEAFGPGEQAQGFVFNGTDRYGRTPAHSDLDIGASPLGWTIELWVKPAELRTATLLNWGSTGLLEGMNVHQYYDALVVDWNDTANAPHAVVAFGIFAVNTWVHVGITSDRVSGMGRIYKNGVLVQEQAMGIFATQTNLPLFFGRYRDSSEFYNGTLDEISLYTRPLAMTELQGIYAAGASGRCWMRIRRRW